MTLRHCIHATLLVAALLGLVPAGTLHGAHVGAQGVTCLEAHLPAGTLHPSPRRVAGWGLSQG